MSTRPELKRVSFIFCVLFFGVIGVMTLGLWNSESASKMKQYWKVYEVTINGENITDKFKTKSLTFLDNDKLLLPVHENSKVTLPLKYREWNYKRRGLFQGVIEIKDIKHSIFDGKYEIEILDHNDPQVVKLTSETIEIYLKAVEGFSLENQSIETN